MENEAVSTAASDSISEEEVEVPEVDFVYKLKKPRSWNGEMIESVDVSGLENLTTLDAQEIETTMRQLKHVPQGNKFQDTLYCKHILMKVTGYPADFFNLLSMKDMEELKARVHLFFVFI